MVGAAFRMAVEIGVQASLPRPQLVVCLYLAGAQPGDPDSTLLRLIQDSDSVLVRPMSDCKSKPLRTDLTTNVISAYVTPLRVREDGTASMVIGYYENGLWAGEWKCTGRKEPDGWLLSCMLDWIS